MKKIITFCIFTISFNLSLNAQVVSIGTANQIIYTIFNMQDPYTRHAAVYNSSEIGQSGNIVSLGWNINKIWNNSDGPVKVYLKQFTGILNQDTWANIKSGATLVYNNTVTFPTSANNEWFTLPLSTPFSYNNAEGLLVLVESNYGGSGNGNTGGDIDFNATSGMSGMSEFWWGNPIQSTGTLSTNRPLIQITFNTTTHQTEKYSKSFPLNVFPNPFSNDLTLNYQFDKTHPTIIRIFNMNGSIVFQETVTETVDIHRIELGKELSKGSYLLLIQNDNEILKTIITNKL